MIEMRWRSAFAWGDVPWIPMFNDRSEGGHYVLQYREWPAGIHPEVELGKNPHIEPAWQDVPFEAAKVTT